MRAPPPPRARAHGAPAAASSTTRADSPAPWPYGTPATPARPSPPAGSSVPFGVAAGHRAPSTAHKPAPARCSVAPSDDARPTVVPPQKTMASRDKPEALRSLYPARRLGSRARNGHQPPDVLIRHRHLDRLTPSCHDTAPRSANLKRGIHQHPSSSMDPVSSMPVSWNRSSRYRDEP